MVKSNWTKEQEDAIKIRGKNLLVSAAAGSGKTAVLTERIVELVDKEKCDILNMLIVTFTNAAATEMKKRIQTKLQERIDSYKAKKDSQEHIEFLISQIENVSKASISTVHSFCLKIVRENFVEVGIDPTFRIIDKNISIQIKEKAIEEIFDEEYIKSEKVFFDLIEGYSQAKGDKKLKEIILNISEFTTAKENQFDWLKEQIKFYEKVLNCRSNEEVFEINEFKKILNVFTKRVVDESNIAIEIIDNIIEQYFSYGEKFVKFLENEKGYFFDIISKIESNEIEFLLNFKKAEFDRFSRPKDIEKEEWKIVQSLRDSSKNIYNNLSKEILLFDERIFLEDFRYIARIMKKLLQLVIDFKKRYFKLKIENVFLDLNDIEHLTLKILENKKIAEDLQTKYKYIFYDEYQDTNRVQEAIINAIKREDNLFLVGDVKQSIYKFRLADPSIFNEKFKIFADENTINSQRIDLSKNFRSTRKILDFCNFIFDAIMTEDFGEIDYKNAGHKLILGQTEEKKDSDINLIYIEQDKQDDNDEYEEYDKEGENESIDIEDIKLEAIYVADEIEKIIVNNKNEIKELNKRYDEEIKDIKNKIFLAKKLQNNREVTDLEERLKEKEKNKILDVKKIRIDYKDIAILFRELKNKSHIIEDLFKEKNIPYFLDYSVNPYQRIEIRSIINYLKIIDNIKQDEALIGVMSSKFANFTYDELAQIRKEYPKGEFYSACELYSSYKTDKIAEKLNKFYDLVREDVIKEKMISLNEFIWHIIQKYDFDTFVYSLESGEERVENILSLINEAKNYEQNYMYGLSGFLNHIKPLLDGVVESSQNKTSSGHNAVNIMSIHKSKGLEYKVVFLCDMSKKFNEEELKKDVILHNELGIAIKYKDAYKKIYSDNIVRMIIRNKKSVENISEEIRILYVALTRAGQKLYLINRIKNTEKYFNELKKYNIKRVLSEKKTYRDLVTYPVLEHLTEDEIGDIVYKKYKELNIYESEIKISILHQDQIISKREEYDNKKINFYEIMQKQNIDNIFKLEKYDKFVYEYEDKIKKRSKTSISEIVKSDFKKENEYKINKPQFDVDENFSKAQIGTIVHLVMQHLPIKKYDIDSIKEEIDILVKKEKLLEEEKEIIDINKILLFFNSELGKRVISADRVEREKKFMMKVDGFIAEGIIDCYFEEKGKIIIIDYKTDSNIDYERHKAQLELYKTAVEAMENKKVEFSYVYWINHSKISEYSW